MDTSIQHGDGGMKCSILGLGAWGPGFRNWHELQPLLRDASHANEPAMVAPRPEIIPANERRRSPLPVKIAVETSWQAVQQANIHANDMICVFGSGLGDTQITDYMCRELNTELKQLSPTKFHNSVHNAAAGYWTISTNCMKSANSIAAYHETAGMALLEAYSQALYQNEPALITLFDTKAYSVYHEIFDCDLDFSGALVISPNLENESALATMEIRLNKGSCEHRALHNRRLDRLYQTNPAAKALSIFELFATHKHNSGEASAQLPISGKSHLSVTVQRTS